METAFPFILQNLHRYFLYLAFIPLFFLWFDAALVAVTHEGSRGSGSASSILFVNAFLLTGYSLSCHSLRHLVGGRLDCFSCTRRTQVRYSLWQRLTSLNLHHMAWAWASLISVDVRRRLRPPARDRRHHRPGDPLLGGATPMPDPTTLQRRAARRPGDRRRRRRAAGRDRGEGRRRRRRPRLQVAARQGPHGDGRGRRGGGPRPRRAADSWQVHFRDTMVGGKLLNNPRMAQLHAQEAPDRVRELELWGAVFDRTADGRILQRPFGGHSHPRLAHVGDRTGLEMIRTLQDRAVAAGIEVYMECTVTRLITGSRRRDRGVRLLADDRPADRRSRPRPSSSRPAGSARPTR